MYIIAYILYFVNPIVRHCVHIYTLVRLGKLPQNIRIALLWGVFMIKFLSQNTR